MNDVTFLFGAGASKNALPIVNEIPDRIDKVIDILQKDEFRLSDSEIFEKLGINTSKRDCQQILISDFKWIAEESRRSASIDTLAKKLLIKSKKPDLLKLKGVLSIFFIIEQIRNPIDKRYDTFFASILNNNAFSLPAQVKIISWNYDYQFEKAFSEYSQDSNIDSNANSLNVISKYIIESDDYNRFCIFKLNGTTNLRDREGFRVINYCDNINQSISFELIEQLVQSYTALLNLSNNYYPNLSFAWERNPNNEKNIVSKTKNGIYKTKILVVIGYSFPFFNREIDREIINSMEGLEKVYFQSPEADALKERFMSIRNDLKSENLILKHDTSYFFLPNEL